MTLQMIDEASFQTRTWDAAALKAAGIGVVWVKATEGTYYVSPDYAWQLGQARAAGCDIIHSHVAAYGTVTAEVAYFLSHADLRPGECVGLDNEAPQVERPGPAAASTWTLSYSQQVKAHSKAVACIQYTSDDPIRIGCFEGVRGVEPLFLAWPGADPASPPAPSRPWLLSFLQFGTRNRAGTITDADAAYFGSVDQVRKLGIPAAPPPPPGVHGQVSADGKTSLAQLAARAGCSIEAVVWLTAQPSHRPTGFGPLEAAYVRAGRWDLPMPAGTVVWVP